MSVYDWDGRSSELSRELISSVPIEKLTAAELRDFKAAIAKLHDLEEKEVPAEQRQLVKLIREFEAHSNQTGDPVGGCGECLRLFEALLKVADRIEASAQPQEVPAEQRAAPEMGTCESNKLPHLYDDEYCKDWIAQKAQPELIVQGSAKGPIWQMLDGQEPHVVGLRFDCGDAGAVYLTHEQARELSKDLAKLITVKGAVNENL